jgi:hypothetical protein
VVVQQLVGARRAHENVLTGPDSAGAVTDSAGTVGRQWIGIDISPIDYRVMAKRLRDVCKLREDESLWRAGRGFVVRNLP